MNNTTTRRNLSIVAVLLAATLVVGTIAATQSTQSAVAYLQNKKGADKKDRNGNGNGNTITIQKCKQAATQSGWDNDQGQECENVICTHPGSGATCVSEGAKVSPVSNQTGGAVAGEACPSGLVRATVVEGPLTGSSVCVSLIGAGPSGPVNGPAFACPVTGPTTKVQLDGILICVTPPST